VRSSRSSSAITSRGVIVRLLIFGVCVLVVGALASLVSSDREPGIDRHAFRLLGLARGSFLADVAKPASKIAPVILAIFVLVAVLLLLRRGARREAVTIVTGFLLCEVGAHLAKTAAARPRPSGALVSAGGFSFPSTSSALCVGFIAIAVAFARMSTERRRQVVPIVASCLLTLGAGLLFIAIRVHYLSDVIAGWAFGVAAFTFCDLAGLAVYSLLASETSGHS
jgi:membrane-associated phospholipid phosphatase